MLTKLDINIAKQRAEGATMAQIGTLNNMPKSTVRNHLSKSEVKELIERTHRKLIAEGTETAAQNLIDTIKSTEDDIEHRKERNKISQVILQAAGILPSHTQSVFIQQIYNDNSTTITAELGQLRAFIAHQWGTQDDPPVIDVAPTSYNASIGDNAADENPNDNNGIDGNAT